MTVITVSAPHTLSVDEACKRAKTFEPLLRRFGGKAVWEGTSVKVKGPSVSGEIKITDKLITVSVTLGPLVTKLVKPEKVEETIRTHMIQTLEG